MAIQKQLNVLRQGATKWNSWREQNRKVPIGLSFGILSGANLSGANLSGADLSGADLSGADLGLGILSGANLSRANLSGADLRGANLIEADLSGADLSGAKLSGASFSFANLSGANLSRANLSRADLSRADLSGADLSEANLSGANIGWTTFGSLDLRTVIGLETIHHRGPSEISTSTLERSEGDIPDIFLREAGLSETFITYARSLTQSPIQYYTCFISYSSKDQKFAERLHADLRQKGIKCWFAPEDLKIGEKFPNRIEEAIRLYDKLLIILSQNSINSSWVEDEARAALEKEAHLKKKQPNQTVLFPIQIDSSIEQCQSQWVAKLRRERHIGDFTRWKYHARYEKAFQRLIHDLQPGQQ